MTWTTSISAARATFTGDGVATVSGSPAGRLRWRICPDENQLGRDGYRRIRLAVDIDPLGRYGSPSAIFHRHAHWNGGSVDLAERAGWPVRGSPAVAAQSAEARCSRRVVETVGPSRRARRPSKDTRVDHPCNRRSGTAAAPADALPLGDTFLWGLRDQRRARLRLGFGQLPAGSHSAVAPAFARAVTTSVFILDGLSAAPRCRSGWLGSRDRRTPDHHGRRRQRPFLRSPPFPSVRALGRRGSS